MGVEMVGRRVEQSRCYICALCLLSLAFGSGAGRVLGLVVGKGELGVAETGLGIKKWRFFGNVLIWGDLRIGFGDNGGSPRDFYLGERVILEFDARTSRAG